MFKNLKKELDSIKDSDEPLFSFFREKYHIKNSLQFKRIFNAIKKHSVRENAERVNAFIIDALSDIEICSQMRILEYVFAWLIEGNSFELLKKMEPDIQKKFAEYVFLQVALNNDMQKSMNYIMGSELFSPDLIFQLAIKYRNANLIQSLQEHPDFKAVISKVEVSEDAPMAQYLQEVKAPDSVTRSYYSMEQERKSLTSFAAAVSLAERVERKKTRQDAPYVFLPRIVEENSLNAAASEIIKLMEPGDSRILVFPGSHWTASKVYKNSKGGIQIVYFDPLLDKRSDALNYKEMVNIFLGSFVEALFVEGAESIDIYSNAYKQQNASSGCREFAMQIAEKMAVAGKYVEEGSLLKYVQSDSRCLEQQDCKTKKGDPYSISVVDFPLSLKRGTESRALFDTTREDCRLLTKPEDEQGKPINKAGEPAAKVFKSSFHSDSHFPQSPPPLLNTFNAVKRQSRFKHCIDFFKEKTDEEIKEMTDSILLKSPNVSPRVSKASFKQQK